MTAKLSVVFRLLCVVKDTRIRFFSYLALLKFSNYVSFLSFFCFYTSINAQSLIPVHTVQKKIFLFDNYNEFQAWFDTKLSLEGEVFFILTKSFKDHALSDSLVFAKHRGVNVQILMPHKATNELDSQFSRFKIFHINLGLHNGSFIKKYVYTYIMNSRHSWHVNTYLDPNYKKKSIEVRPVKKEELENLKVLQKKLNLFREKSKLSLYLKKEKRKEKLNNRVKKWSNIKAYSYGYEKEAKNKNIAKTLPKKLKTSQLLLGDE